MKKIIIGMAVVASFLVACNGTVTVKEGDGAAPDKNKQTAMNSEMGFNKHDVEAIFKDCSTDYVDYGSEGKPQKSMDSIKMEMKAFFAGFPDFKGENMVAVADSNMVIVTGTWSGTFKNEFMKIKPTGKSFNVPDADIFTFNKDGKIISHRSIQSSATFLSQLGVTMPKAKK